MEKELPTAGIQRRFKQWREQQGYSLREVQEAVNKHLPNERQIRSPATISNYEITTGGDGKQKPPPRADFVAALAAAFGPEEIYPTWLLSGEEPMNAKEEEAERISEAALRDAEGDPAWKRRVRFKWDVLAALGVSPPDMKAVGYDVDEDGYIVPEHATKVMDAWAESVNASQIPAWLPPLLEAGRRLDVDALTLGSALRGPLAALDLDADAMTREELGDYVTTMIPVLLTLESHHEEEGSDG